ncbi:MAG: DUF460 domain-containing protein [Candidatus Altiarchaeota archaeon]|nr:DUF460 domain-containing protein [Candidatus Altiarchaeota archaeon]
MYLIVGVDPGTTTGVAVLNFRGEPVDLFSSKDLSMDKIIHRLVKSGRSSVIATDVNPAPGFVSKLAAQLGARVYTPPESLSVSEKIDLTRNHKTSDAHQRDSLAAALFTFNRFKNRLQKIDSMNLGDDVKHLVLQGHSTSEAKKMLQEEEPEAVIEPPLREEREPTEEEKQIRRLEKQNLSLRKQLEERDREIRDLLKKISATKRAYRVELRREDEIKRRDFSLKSMESSLQHMRNRLEDLEELSRLWKKLSKGEVKPIGVFPEVYNGYTVVLRRLKKKDLDLLDKVKVAFTPEKANHSILASRNIFVTGIEYLREVSGCYFISADDISKLTKAAVSLEKIVEDYRSHRIT